MRKRMNLMWSKGKWYKGTKMTPWLVIPSHSQSTLLPWYQSTMMIPVCKKVQVCNKKKITGFVFASLAFSSLVFSSRLLYLSFLFSLSLLFWSLLVLHFCCTLFSSIFLIWFHEQWMSANVGKINQWWWSTFVHNGDDDAHDEKWLFESSCSSSFRPRRE